MIGSKWAASISTSVVVPVTSEVAPPMTPAMASGVSAAVGDEQVLGVEGARDVVEGGELLPGPGPARADRARQGVEVEGVQRLAEQRASRSW